MKKILQRTAYACILILYSVKSIHAQTKVAPQQMQATVLQQPATPKSSSKLSPELKKLYENSASNLKKEESVKPDLSSKPVPAGDALNKYMQIKGDKVVVDITVKQDMATAKAALQKMGLQINAVFGRVISGTIPIASLPQLESATSVQFVKPAYKPMHQSKPVSYFTPWNINGNKITPVISQGDTAQRSYIARKKYHVDGNGVKIGILSDSYNNLGTADIGVAHGELPGQLNPFNYKKPVQVLSDLDSGGTDEGRAMLEIVHDVAPGSPLAFHTGDNGQADFAQGIQDLSNAGCTVIGDDLIYFAEPFFQDGIIAQSVDMVKKKGVTYFSAAGNESIRSYESDYRATQFEPFGAGNGTAQNFSASTDAPRYYQPIYIPSGGSAIFSFQWDQSSFTASGVGCQTDFDIYLTDIYGNIVAAGASDNILSGDPIEIFGYYNNTANYTFFLTIVKYAGPDVSRLKYMMYDDALFYLTNPAIPGILAPTIVGHAKADGAIATGAAFYLNTPAYGVDTPLVENFASVGGVANYYDIEGNRIAPLIRNKPEIVAPDGVNTSFFGQDITQDADTFPNFFGTSAATPHAVGVAALMIEAQKLNTLTPDQIKGILESTAIDMDNIYTTGFDKGFDYNTGYGFIKADAAVGTVKFPNLFVKNLEVKAICSSDPSVKNWEIINPNPFEVDVNWFVIGTHQHGTITVSSGDTTFTTNAVSYGRTQIPSLAVIDWEDNFSFTRFDAASSTSAHCGQNSTSNSTENSITGVTAETVTKTNLAEVYPNPSTSTFRLYLSLADQQNVNIQLYSVDGKKLTEQTVNQSNGIVNIDASGYKPGVYLLTVKQGNFYKILKLIKQ